MSARADERDERPSDSLASVSRTLAASCPTRADDWHPVFRARHGMLAVLRALRRVRGEGEVITQLLTCCTAVDPIVVSGLIPRYGDISLDSLSLDEELLPVSDATRAIVMQHTFGIIDPDQARGLRAAADAAGCLLVEDSAHCVCRMALDGEGRPIADVALHSFGMGKMCDSCFGGAIWVNPDMADVELHDAIVSELAQLPEVPRKIDVATSTYDLSIRVIMRLPTTLRRALWDRLAHAGVFVPAVTTGERGGEVFLEPSQPGPRTLAVMEEALAGLPAVMERARPATSAYAEGLSTLVDEGLLSIPAAALDAAQPLMRFPLILPSEAASDALIAYLCDHECYCDSWGRPLLYPGPTSTDAFGFDGGLEGLGVTRSCSEGMVALLGGVDVEKARATVHAIRAWFEARR